jgi:hypothetical protein
VGAGFEEGASEAVDCCRIVGRAVPVLPAGAGNQPEVLGGLGVRRDAADVCSWSCVYVSAVGEV